LPIAASTAAPSIPDLLIAATAERAALTVFAVSKDFGLIASITGQPVETLAGRRLHAIRHELVVRQRDPNPAGCSTFHQ
jgi:hypothetical protein